MVASSDTTSLRAEGICVSFDQAPVITDASLSVHPGARLAVVGANGAGKTTLLETLSGAITPQEGRVTRDGMALRHTRRGLIEHRQQVQLVLQDPDDQLLSAEVYADVSFGPTNLGLGADEIRARVDEALELLEITPLAHRPIHHLSFGQRKRVAIAGAVAMRPAYLLLDEPTAGLDPAGVEALLATMARLEGHGTVIALSTHDLALAWVWADEVALVQSGTVEQRPAHEVLADRAVLRRAGLRPPWQAEILEAADAPWDPLDPPRTPAQLVAALAAPARRVNS